MVTSKLHCGGVYVIRCVPTDKRYVGSTSDFAKRSRDHQYDLRTARHDNRLLLRAWRKYGADAFVFEIVETVSDIATVFGREQYWIDHFDAANPKHGFNLAPVAGSTLGVKMALEVVEANRLRNLGNVVPEAVRQQISRSTLGTKKSPEMRAKLRGIKRSVATRRKMAAAAVEREARKRAAITDIRQLALGV